jgi:hypothetical protein
MAKQVQVRVMTPGEYVAEMLEAEAKRMPRSYKVQADVLRKQAQLNVRAARQEARACVGSNGVRVSNPYIIWAWLFAIAGELKASSRPWITAPTCAWIAGISSSA